MNDKWMDGDQWVIHVGWRDGSNWGRDQRWGVCPEKAWREETDMAVYESAALIGWAGGYGPMTPRPLVKVIEKIGAAPDVSAKIIYRLVNLRTGEVIPWDALQ